MQNLLLQHGSNIMIIESDQIWSTDITHVIRKGFQTHFDLIAGDELGHEMDKARGYICGGFYGIGSNAKTKPFFNRFVRLHSKRLMPFAGQKGKISVENDQSLLSRMVKLDHLTVHWLNVCEYTNVIWYSSPTLRENCKEDASYVLHNNYIVGTSSKVLRAKEWGHWFLKDESTCV